jgi:hypothetical protein
VDFVSYRRDFVVAMSEADFRSDRDRRLDGSKTVGLFESCADHRLSLLAADLEMSLNGASNAATS